MEVEIMLSNEELFLSGDVDTLYERNMKLMYHLADKFSNLNFDQDDFIGCGDIAFVKAIKIFDPNKSKWSTFFSRIMVNEILMMNRSLKKQVETISLETIICVDNDCNILTLQDVLQDPADIEDEVMNRMAIDKVLKAAEKITSQKREILRLYLNETKQRDIGKKLNLSQSHISKVIKSLFLELKETFEKDAC